MSTIINMARAIQAVCQPLTGPRAFGTVRFEIVPATFPGDIEPGSYLFPVLNGAVRYDLVYKVRKNSATPNGHWFVGGSGPTDVAVMSNIGGARFNVPKGTIFVPEAPWRTSNLKPKPRTFDGFTGGADPTDDLALYNFVTFESFGSQPSLELFRSAIGGRFPAAIMFWNESEPADGQSTTAVARPTHRGAGRASYSEIFEIMVISSRSDSEQERRAQPLRILDAMSALLVDRQAVDDVAFSSPGGVHIRKRYRLGNTDAFYKVFQAYALSISAQMTIVQTDSRSYDPLLKFRIDAPQSFVGDGSDEDPPENLPLVENNLVDNPADP